MNNKVPCGGFYLGKSLVIKDNQLDLAPGAGSDNLFKVTITTTEDLDSFTPDKTIEEVWEAYNSGKYVYAELTIPSGHENGVSELITGHLTLEGAFIAMTENGALLSAKFIFCGFRVNNAYGKLCLLIGLKKIQM